MSTAVAIQGAGAVPSQAYQVSITQRDPPNHGIVADLYDKPPTPTEGGGGWEEVALPKRGAVLIWRGRGLMKLALSLVFDDYAAGNAVINDAYLTLLRFWRPEGDSTHIDYATVEPSILRLNSTGDVVPYRNLNWVISSLEWGVAQGNADGNRTQQMLDLTFTEYRADERLRPIKTVRTKPYIVKKGDTLAKIAKRHKITAKALGAMQKPPIADTRKLKVGQKIVVPVP